MVARSRYLVNLSYVYIYKNDNIIDSDFFYKKNAQNDIIGIYNSEGKEIAKYYYDAWGNQKIKYLVETDSNTIEYVDIGEDFDYNDISNINRFIAYKNPFRYRSYYWDFETGLYYLNSRYYDPELGRFINADAISILSQSQVDLNGLNLYAYCFNNPVNDYDELGFWSWKRLLKAVLVIAVVVVAVVVVAAVTAATGGSGTAVLIGAAVGAASGALSYSGQVLYQGITTGDWSWSWSNFLGATIGGTFGGMISIIPKLPNSIGATGDRKYWLRDSVLFHKWSTGNEAQASYVENDFINYASTAKALGVRPIIKHPNLKEFLQNTNITLANNIETAIIGEFPNCNLSIEIFNPFTLAKFKPTGKTYTLLARKREEGSRFHLYDCPEYIYDGQKFVEFDFQYFLVEPVKFYIDKTNNMLISKKVLFDAPININSTDYDGNFETSQLYNYLNGWFIKNLVPELKTRKQLRKE